MSSKEKLTKSALFLMPALGFEEKKLRKIGFVNAFSISKDRKDEDCIFLLFLTEEQQDLGQFITENQSKIIEEIDYEGGYTVLVCPFPVRYIRDKQLFWEGKYSKFSNEFRNFFRGPDTKLQLSIINKSPDLRELLETQLDVVLPKDSEVGGIPNREQETLDISKYTK